MKKTLITIGAVSVALLLIVWAFSYSQAKNQERAAEIVRQQELERRVKLNECMDHVYQTYSDNWDSGCRSEGKGDDCELPIWRADELDATFERDKDRCVELYK